MRTIKTTTGAELELDGDLLAVMELLYREVTARRALDRTFEDMGLKEDLLRGIYAYGFEKPSAIQQRAIVPCIKGNDVIAQAQSGTGKTATFSVAILQKVNSSSAVGQILPSLFGLSKTV